MPISCNVEDKVRHQMLLDKILFLLIYVGIFNPCIYLCACTSLFQCKSTNVFFIENVLIHGYPFTFEDETSVIVSWTLVLLFCIINFLIPVNIKFQHLKYFPILILHYWLVFCHKNSLYLEHLFFYSASSTFSYL